MYCAAAEESQDDFVSLAGASTSPQFIYTLRIIHVCFTAAVAEPREKTDDDSTTLAGASTSPHFVHITYYIHVYVCFTAAAEELLYKRAKIDTTRLASASTSQPFSPPTTTANNIPCFPLVSRKNTSFYTY